MISFEENLYFRSSAQITNNWTSPITQLTRSYLYNYGRSHIY